MATTYPYISSAGPVVKTMERFRKQFPQEVSAETLRKLGIAPKNESYVINILKFLGLIDGDGKRVADRTKAFHQSDDSKFAELLKSIVEQSYSALFDLYGEGGWAMGRDELVTFFRESDGSSDLVGRRQALTFQTLAALSGHGEIAATRPTATAAKPSSSARTSRAQEKPKNAAQAQETSTVQVGGVPSGSGPDSGSERVGLTVRIEVNLPADGDQQTYDAIFKSIRTNLIDRE